MLVTLAAARSARSSYGHVGRRVRCETSRRVALVADVRDGGRRRRAIASSRSAARPTTPGAAAPRASSPIEVRLAPTGPDAVPQGGRLRLPRDRCATRRPTPGEQQGRAQPRRARRRQRPVRGGGEARARPRADATLTLRRSCPRHGSRSLGDYAIAATVDGRRRGQTGCASRSPGHRSRCRASTTSTTTAGVRTTVPGAGSAARSPAAPRGATSDGDGNLDLFVTRLGKPARLYMGDGKRATSASRRRGAGRMSASRRVRRSPTTTATGARTCSSRASGHPSLLLRNVGRALRRTSTRRAGSRRRRQRVRRRVGRRGRRRRPRPVRRQLRAPASGRGTRVSTSLSKRALQPPGGSYRNDGDGSFSDVTSRPARRDARRGVHRRVVRRRRRRAPRPVPGQRLRRPASGLQPDVAQHAATGACATCRTRRARRSFMNTMGIGVGDVDRDGAAGPRAVEHRRQPAAAQRRERDVHRRGRRVRRSRGRGSARAARRSRGASGSPT